MLFPDFPVQSRSTGTFAARAVCVCCTLLVTSICAFAAPPTVVATCAECHGDDGMGQGNPLVPVIAGIPAGHIEQAIYAYVDGARHCVREPRMCATVSALSETEVVAVADYFAAQQRGSPREEFDPNLAAEGEQLHQQHCSNCHLPPDDRSVADAIGFPLHGQRSEYLHYAIEAYFTGEREALVEPMADQIRSLRPGDLSALVNYYSSYRAEE